MLNFIDYNKNKLVEIVQAPTKVTAPQSADKFDSWKNIFKKISEYKTKVNTTTKSTTEIPPEPFANGSGVFLKVNVGFTIESHRGHNYDFVYATTGKKQTDVPLYYVKSDDENIKNTFTDYIFVEEKDWNNIKSIFEVLKSWTMKQQSPTTSPTPVQQQKITTEKRTFSSLLEEIQNVANLNNYMMSQIGNPNGEFKTYNRFNEINYTINKLLFGDNSKYKLKDMKYSEFIGIENKFQPMSKKEELAPSSNWYLRKKMKDAQGDEYYFPVKFGKQIKIGDILIIQKNNTEEEVKIKVSKISVKNK